MTYTAAARSPIAASGSPAVTVRPDSGHAPVGDGAGTVLVPPGYVGRPDGGSLSAFTRYGSGSLLPLCPGVAAVPHPATASTPAATAATPTAYFPPTITR
ncbi:hypothetical protein [Actinacidiphila alni]|uniref:hypothetical protein n=1 Tax=Actinacidiphila alni TaxID=380248 RepID=UPI001FE344AA|nr:hypothetical protein [Actinacidiphila alni]